MAGALLGGAPRADCAHMFVQSPVFAAARSRAHGPTAAMWHAVKLHRVHGEIDDACELTLCGSLARVSAAERWPVPTRDVCSTCVTLSR